MFSTTCSQHSLHGLFLKKRFYLFNFVVPGCGHFMYFDSSLGSEGVLASPDFLAPTGQQCISFDVNMYSSDISNMGTLTVYFFQQSFEDNRKFIEEVVWQSNPNLTPTNKSWHKVNFDVFNIDNRNVYKVSRKPYFNFIFPHYSFFTY